jgi:hypothetical protein
VDRGPDRGPDAVTEVTSVAAITKKTAMTPPMKTLTQKRHPPRLIPCETHPKVVVSILLHLRLREATLTLAVAIITAIIMVYHRPLDHTEDEVADAAVVGGRLPRFRPITVPSTCVL